MMYRKICNTEQQKSMISSWSMRDLFCCSVPWKAFTYTWSLQWLTRDFHFWIDGQYNPCTTCMYPSHTQQYISCSNYGRKVRKSLDLQWVRSICYIRDEPSWPPPYSRALRLHFVALFPTSKVDPFSTSLD